MNVHDFLADPYWWEPEKIKSLFDWATSPEIEASGEARRQLGYYAGYYGDEPSTQNPDYLRGYRQGLAMRESEIN